MAALSALELLALVTGTGQRARSSLTVARNLLEDYGSLRELALAAPEELRRIAGLGPARACAVAAAFELGRRASAAVMADARRVESPADAVDLLAPLLAERTQEAVVVLSLGARHQPLQLRTVALGAINAASVHPREVFRGAVRVGAAALVLAHNHPSGDPEPSEDDIRLTRRMARCGQTLGIEVLDHVVVAGKRWVSLRERRILQ